MIRKILTASILVLLLAAVDILDTIRPDMPWFLERFSGIGLLVITFILITVTAYQIPHRLAIRINNLLIKTVLVVILVAGSVTVTFLVWDSRESILVTAFTVLLVVSALLQLLVSNGVSGGLHSFIFHACRTTAGVQLAVANMILLLYVLYPGITYRIG
jgi:hypothetical protein